MNKPQQIQVRRYLGDSAREFVVVQTIKRKVYVDQVGNFNRYACRYRGKTYLVNSDAGDIGDPFRADESYLTTLHIDLDQPCQWNLP